MSKLVPPARLAIRQDRHCLLARKRNARPSAAEARKSFSRSAARLARGLRRAHAGDGRLHAARRLHGSRRLARLLHRHEACATACSGRSRLRSQSSKDLAGGIHAEEEVALVDAETGEILAAHDRAREIFDRQAVRGRARLSHRRPEASRASRRCCGQGEVNLAGPVMVLERRRLSRQISEPLYPPGRIAGHVPRKGLVECRGFPDPQSDAPQPRAPGQDRGRGHRTAFSSIRCWGS